MRSAVSITVLACLGLTACASGPKPDLRLPAAYEAPAQAATTPAGASALEIWWTAFNDPQLTGLIEDALAANPDAKTAAARLREASATRASALSRFLPQGNPGYSFSRANTKGGLNLPGLNIPGLTSGGVTDSYSLNFNVSWEVDVFGRLFAAKHVADADVAAAGFDYITARTSLAAEVADAYFQARGLAIQLADARETARIERELYDVADRRAKAGLAPSSEPDRVAGDLAQSNAQVANLEGELQIQRRALLILAGRYVEPTTGVDVPPFVGEAPPIPASLPSDLLRRRPDVRSAEAQLVGAVGRKNVARMAFLPTFTLRPGYGWSKALQAASSTVSSTWTIGGGVTQPVFDIPNLLAQLKISDARAEQAAFAYEKAVQSAFSESEGALVRLEADRRRVVLLTDGEARARRAYRASLRGYQLGLNDLDTTLSSEQGWRSVRVQLTSAQVQTLRQAVLAYKALGGGWTVGEPPPKPLAANPRVAVPRAE